VAENAGNASGGKSGKVRAWRERMRARGLRPVQVWVPDTRSPNFPAEAHRQSRRVAESAQAGADQAFIDAITERSEG